MKTYYPLLDAVRFFAAFWVMNYHYLLVLGLSDHIHWYRYGNLGVQLFFIISGFVIVQSLHNKTLKEFAIGRFIRLFPLFWILCSITYILTLIIPHTAHLPITEYYRSMTMFGDIFDKIIGPGGLIDPSYWTLTVELLFYISIGIYTSLFSYNKIRYFLIVWLAISMLAFFYHIDENFYVKLLLVRHASYFIFGSAFALIVTNKVVTRYEHTIDIGILGASALYAMYINPRAIPAYLTPNQLDTYIVTILHIIFFISIPLLVYVSSYVKQKKLIALFTILGGITYPLYLLHQKIGNAVINYIASKCTVPWNTLAILFEVFIMVTAYFVYVQDKKMRSFIYKYLHKDSMQTSTRMRVENNREGILDSNL